VLPVLAVPHATVDADAPACVCSWARPDALRCVTGETYAPQCPPGTREFSTADADRLRTFLRVSVGRMRAHEHRGDLQRFEIEGDWTDELASVTTHWGFVFGIERWESARATTLGVPVHLYYGPRVGPFFASVGPGFTLMGYDAVRRDASLSFVEPFAMGALGIDIARWVRLSFDGRAAYRWNTIGPHDRTVLQIGLSLAVRVHSDTQ
jgi:hypothetical protein